jgi:Domain of unknown function (DUF4249)
MYQANSKIFSQTMIYKITYFYAAICCLMLAFHCKPIEPSFPFEGKKMVLYGFLMPDTVITIQVSESQGALDKPTELPITNALLVLFKDGNPLDTLAHAGIGVYRTTPDVVLEEGRLYHIQAKASGFPDAISVPERIPIPPKVLSVLVDKNTGSVTGNPSVTINVEPSTENPPALALHFNARDTLGVISRYSLGFLEGCPNGGGYVSQLLFCFDIGCLSNRSSFGFEGYRLPNGNTAFGWIGYTSQAFLDFHSDYQRQYDATLDPIFFEPLNVRSNVQGGYGAVVAMSPQWISFAF